MDLHEKNENDSLIKHFFYSFKMASYSSKLQGDLLVSHDIHVVHDLIADNQITTEFFQSNQKATFAGGVDFDGSGNAQFIQNFFNLATIDATPTQILNAPQQNGQSSFCDFMIIGTIAGVASATYAGQFKALNIAGVTSITATSPLNTTIDAGMVGAMITTQAIGNAFIINVVGLVGQNISWSIFYKILSAT